MAPDEPSQAPSQPGEGPTEAAPSTTGVRCPYCKRVYTIEKATLQSAEGGYLPCRFCGKSAVVVDGKLSADERTSGTKMYDAYQAGDIKGMLRHGTTAVGGTVNTGIRAVRPKPENSRAIILILIFLLAGWWAATYIFPGQLSAMGLSASGWIDALKGRVSPKIADLTEQMSDPWGKAERETKVGTTVVGDVAKREGMSIDVPPGGFPSLAGGAYDQWLEAKVVNTGYTARDVKLTLENCSQVNGIVFNKETDPAKAANFMGEGFEGEGGVCPFSIKPWHYNSNTPAAAIVEPADITIQTFPRLPDPVKFYLGPAKSDLPTDNPKDVKIKSVNGKVVLEYDLGEAYRLLTYDIRKGGIATTQESAQAYVTGGPLGVKLWATEKEVQPAKPLRLNLDFLLYGSDTDTTTEELKMEANKVHIHVPTELVKEDAPLSRQENVVCANETSGFKPVETVRNYYECKITEPVLLSEGGPVFTVTLSLNPSKQLPEKISPVVIEVDDMGYHHKIEKERAITVTPQAKTGTVR